MYKSYIAGEQEPRLSSAFLYPNDGEIYWDSVLGGRVGLLRFGNRDPVLSEGFQLDVEAGAFLRMQPQEERDVRSVDFRGGFPLTWREGPWQAKFGYYHISSHLGDEFQLKNPTFIRNNYSRDALIWGLGYFLTDAFRVYGELGWAFYLTGGAEPWEFQTGFDWANTGPTGPWGEPFLAANVHLWEETDWSGALNVLAGWQWRTDASDNTLRLGLQFYNGASNQKAFQHQTDEFLGLQLRYDF